MPFLSLPYMCSLSVDTLCFCPLTLCSHCSGLRPPYCLFSSGGILSLPKAHLILTDRPIMTWTPWLALLLLAAGVSCAILTLTSRIVMSGLVSFMAKDGVLLACLSSREFKNLQRIKFNKLLLDLKATSGCKNIYNTLSRRSLWKGHRKRMLSKNPAWVSKLLATK